MFACPIHRANLGKDWGNPTGRTECRYPDHKGKQTCVKSDRVSGSDCKNCRQPRNFQNLLVVSANSRLADGRLQKLRGIQIQIMSNAGNGKRNSNGI